MEKIIIFLTVLCLSLASCTKAKTDYKAEIETVVPEQSDFKEVTSFQNGPHTVRIEALGGNFHKGYNAVRLRIDNANETGKPAITAATFLPILTDSEGKDQSCPHRYNLIYRSDTGYFEGYVVYTEESTAKANWNLHISFSTTDQQYKSKQSILVQKQNNKNLNMTSFIGNDQQQYIIALIKPQNPKVAENEIVAGIYKSNKSTSTSTPSPINPIPLSYSEVEGYTLKLDPRMPEPSMGNHSSPNNKDLTQGADQLYHGVVNYTMTGNWTLNFILINQHGRIVKGTTVPNDFTPGVQGLKSELYIDILF